jgi:hypothetical protein
MLGEEFFFFTKNIALYVICYVVMYWKHFYSDINVCLSNVK